MPQFQTKACCIDRAVARLILLGHGLRYTRTNQMVKVIKLFIIYGLQTEETLIYSSRSHQFTSSNVN